tara:strand:- start:5646 stop:6377 length:732 start_codon:yes stop_codon:yes gene_type:complete
MSEIPEKVTEICGEIGISSGEACWQLPQNGNWVMKHKALERIAAHKKIKFDLPQIIETNAEKKLCIICVSGMMGDIKEWSIGEATTYNNKNQYPFAMAEKRAKDRVILKLVGLHGDVYSEDEMPPREEEVEEEKEKEKENYSTIEGAIRQSTNNPKPLLIPKGAKKFPGRNIYDLTHSELLELQEVCTTKKWIKIIEERKADLEPEQPTVDQFVDAEKQRPQTDLVEEFHEANTDWFDGFGSD